MEMMIMSNDVSNEANIKFQTINIMCMCKSNE